MKIIAEPLTEKAFAPYGDVLAAPAEFGRAYFDEGLHTSRASARPSLAVSLVRPLPRLPLEATVMERHEFSSQSFLPLDVSRWIVVVAPPAADGGPDSARAVAFLVGPGQGITYHANTWDHPLTIFGCALAIERNPLAADAIRKSGFDVCSHGWRWIKHFELSRAVEREHIRKAVASFEKTVGERPLGWYCRYGPSINTRELIVEEGGFLYDSDAYNDELPYWR